MSALTITSAFDGGNIARLSSADPGNIRLEIVKDAEADFYQWFYFRLTGARGQACRLNIVNAKGAAYPKGWEDYRAVASDDRQTWRRVPTSYKDGVLTIEDWRENCDRSRTDGDVHMRSTRWYRRRLSRWFVNIGGGVYLKRPVDVAVWSLDRLG